MFIINIVIQNCIQFLKIWYVILPVKIPVIFYNVVYPKKNQISVICIIMNSHQIFNNGHFKVFCHWKIYCFNVMFYKKNVYVKVLHLQGDSKNTFEKYRFLITFRSFQWLVRIYITQEKTRFIKPLSKRSRLTKIKTIGLNELIRWL